MLIRLPAERPGFRTLTFRLEGDPGAVSVVGNFNDWTPGVLVLEPEPVPGAGLTPAQRAVRVARKRRRKAEKAAREASERARLVARDLARRAERLERKTAEAAWRTR